MDCAEVDPDAAGLGQAVELAGHRVLTGTCSWTDPTLLRESDWYPQRDMSAEARLRFYASRFPLAEIDSTYYGPPAAQQARLWTARTPEGFRFHVKAYSLLTGHPTRPGSLWKDLREQLPRELLEKRNIYAKDLPPELVDEAWQRFAEALAPMRDAGRLAAVLFQYPPWFGPRRDNRTVIEALRERLPGYGIAVEFRSPRWTETERDRERTLQMLEELSISFVGVDAPRASGLPRLFAVTNPELAVIRFHGRSEQTWSGRSSSAAERFRYLYSAEELDDFVEPIGNVAGEAAETHLLMNNCYRDYGVRNAAQLRDLLITRAPGA